MRYVVIFIMVSSMARSSEVIGRYTNGCIKDSLALPKDIHGLQVVRRSRNRYYVHSTMKEFLYEFGKRVEKNGHVLLVADTSKKRGGPDKPWHNSHQVGLDVDILLQKHSIAQRRSLTYSEREAVKFISLLTRNKKYIDKNKWGPHILPSVKAAATAKNVQRIFVNPVIKQRLCKLAGNAKWLRRVRPWYNHDAHMHVRLFCPKDSPDCISQSEPPAGHGCGRELDDWVDDIRRRQLAREHFEHDGVRSSALPKRCR